MSPDMLRLLAATASAGAVLLAATSAFAGDWKKGRGHKHHHHHHHGEVIVVQQRPVVYAPRPVVVYPSPMGYAPVYEPRYAPAYGPAYGSGGNLSIGVNVPLR